MSYLAFARKWRPQVFDEVIGQPHITITLKNAITLNRVSHAYLFSGPRGVGKTSVARIFAKSLNCATGPTITPCNKCSNCLEISAGNNMDVLEIDGASHRRIDDIREIGENVKFLPLNSRYKIYIIDEVHMLTKEAFNALLKTLEEPPAHVKFLFATTELSKVIDTIVSRCQRFEFKRIEVNQIVENLKYITKQEQLSVPEDILFEIARMADGSMRDALSILDQVSSLGEGNVINRQDVEMVLGVVGSQSIANFSQFVLDKDAYGCMKFINNLVSQGKDINQFLVSFIDYVRQLVFLKISPQDLSSVVPLSEEDKKKALNMVANVSLEKLIYILNIFVELESKIKKHNMPRIPFEVSVIKVTRMEDLQSLSSILEILKKTGVPAAVKTTVSVEAPQERQNPAPVLREEPVLKPPETLQDFWALVQKEVRQEKMLLGVMLAKAVPVANDGEKFIVKFLKQDNFQREQVATEEHKKLIEKMLEKVFNKPLKFVIDIEVEKKIVKTEEKPEKPKVTNKDILQNPVVKKALNTFKGKVLDISQKN